MPDTMVAGWWSPSITTTVSLSPYVVRNDITDLSEYSIAPPYAARTRVGDGQMSVSEGSCACIPSYAEPSPTSDWGIIRGVRDHGAWLVIRSISAITGARFVRASSSRWNASRVYWSGIVG